MFANFIYYYFPLIIIKFNDCKISDFDFNLFLKTWESVYKLKKNFFLVFDTTNILIPHFKYCIQMSLFIKKIRNFNPQYLQSSVIIIKNKTINNMLDFVFYIQPPVAPVYITETKLSKIINFIKNQHHDNDLFKIKNIIIDNIDAINIIYPSKPLIPFL